MWVVPEGRSVENRTGMESRSGWARGGIVRVGPSQWVVVYSGSWLRHVGVVRLVLFLKGVVGLNGVECAVRAHMVLCRLVTVDRTGLGSSGRTWQVSAGRAGTFCHVQVGLGLSHRMGTFGHVQFGSRLVAEDRLGTESIVKVCRSGSGGQAVTRFGVNCLKGVAGVGGRRNGSSQRVGKQCFVPKCHVWVCLGGSESHG